VVSKYSITELNKYRNINIQVPNTYSRLSDTDSIKAVKATTSLIHSKHIRVGNLDIRYFTGGKGEPLVVVHGGSGGGAKEWLENMTELCQNFTIYAPDLPGFGLSQPIVGDHGVDEFVEFLDDFTTCVGLKSFYLAGHSIGGGIVLRYAVKSRHKVKKLVIIDGMGLGKEIALWVRLMSLSALCRSLGVAAATFMRAVARAVNAVYAPFRFRFMNPLPIAMVLLGASMAIFRQEAAVLVPQLAAVMIPTLLVWGGKDKIVPVSNAYAAARLIPGCQVHVFEDGGHSVYRQKVKEFAHLLTAFLH
jgi:pimeloyl-ACP methyl ester carboxylesterase